MATMRVTSRIVLATLVRRGAFEELAPNVSTPGPTLVENLAHLSQVLLGVLLLLFGTALTLTLVLLPIGLPLVLVGLALIAAPANV
jgi:hypothetical protein